MSAGTRPLPGHWNCPICPFVLVRTPFDVATGRLRLPTKDEDPVSLCPNDGSPLVQATEVVH